MTTPKLLVEHTREKADTFIRVTPAIAKWLRARGIKQNKTVAKVVDDWMKEQEEKGE